MIADGENKNMEGWDYPGLPAASALPVRQGDNIRGELRREM
jgi:hypothetical protein